MPPSLLHGRRRWLPRWSPRGMPAAWRAARGHMLRGWLIAVLCALPCAAVAQPGSAAGTPQFSSEEQRWIRLNPVVRYAVEPDLAPVEYVREGEFCGLSAEYLKAIAERSGLRFERVPTRDWADTQQALLDGRIDLLPNVMPRRVNARVNAHLLYSAPYFVTSSIIITRGNAPVVLDMRDLQDKVVAVRPGSFYARAIAERYPGIHMLDVNDPVAALEAVAQGRADATIGTDVLLVPLMRRRYPGLLGISGTAQELVYRAKVGVRSEHVLLHSIIEKSLASLSAADTDRIDATWSQTADFGRPSLLSIAYYHSRTLLALAAGVLLLGATAWHARRAQRRAQRSEAAKTRFLAIMSHEIRTPMNAVLASIEMLQRSPLDARQQRFASTAAQAADTLLDLLDDVLDLSKLSARRLQLEHLPTDVGALVQQAAELARVSRAQSGVPIQVNIHNPLRMDALIDPTRFRQVVSNLLGNAVKFTALGCIRVKVQLRRLPQESGERHGTLTLRISDTGIGIPADKLDHVFEAYAQADNSTTRRYGGSGLGLTLCRELVQLMGGTLTLRSRQGIGTTVTVNLPVRLQPRAMAPLPPPVSCRTLPPAATTAPPPRVLVVEDHPGNQFVLAEQLQMLRVQAVIVGDGPAALDALAQSAFALVLMDCHLPMMSGYDIARRIRQQQPATPYLPIIAISAAADPAHLAHCIASGMDGVLKKPLRLQELHGVLQSWLGDVWPAPPAPEPLPPSLQVAACSSHDLESLMRTTLYADLGALRHALRQPDPPAAHALAHRIRGAAEVARLPHLADAAGRLEQQLRECLPWQATTITDLADALQSVIEQAFPHASE